MQITEEALRGILKAASGRIDFSKLKSDASLRGSGMDSMEMSNIMLEIEEAYGIKIPDSDLDELDSIGDILDYVRARKVAT